MRDFGSEGPSGHLVGFFSHPNCRRATGPAACLTEGAIFEEPWSEEAGTSKTTAGWPVYQIPSGPAAARPSVEIVPSRRLTGSDPSAQPPAPGLTARAAARLPLGRETSMLASRPRSVAPCEADRAGILPSAPPVRGPASAGLFLATGAPAMACPTAHRLLRNETRSHYPVRPSISPAALRRRRVVGACRRPPRGTTRSPRNRACSHTMRELARSCRVRNRRTQGARTRMDPQDRWPKHPERQRWLPCAGGRSREPAPGWR